MDTVGIYRKGHIHPIVYNQRYAKWGKHRFEPLGEGYEFARWGLLLAELHDGHATLHRSLNNLLQGATKRQRAVGHKV